MTFLFDADKLNLPKYLQLALKLEMRRVPSLRLTTLYGKAEFDPTSSRPTTKAVRLFNKMLAEDRRLALSSPAVTVCQWQS